MSRTLATLATIAALALLAGCTSTPDTANRQPSVRRECEALVRNRIGQASIRHGETTQETHASGATTYTAAGRADTALASYTFKCEATVTPDLTLTTKLVKLEL